MRVQVLLLLVLYGTVLQEYELLNYVCTDLIACSFVL